MTVNAVSVARRLVLAGARIIVALDVPGGTKTVEFDPGAGLSRRPVRLKGSP